MSTTPESAATHSAASAFAAGDMQAAFDLAGSALAHNGAAQEARLIRINAAIKLERWLDAIAAIEPLAAAQPAQSRLRQTLATCWLRAGNAYKASSDWDRAVDAYRKALAADAQNLDARFNLGVLLIDCAKPADAAAQLRAVLTAQPDDLAAALKLAEALIACNERGAATDLLTRLAARLSSREQRRQCSKLLLDACAPSEAKHLALRLIESQADAADWAIEFSRQLRRAGDVAASDEVLRALHARTPEPAERLRIELELALTLPSTYPDAAALQAARHAFIARLDEFVERYPPHVVAEIAPQPELLLADNFYLAYQGENDRAPQQRFGDWLSGSLQRLLPALDVRPRAARAKPRIALVSSRWHECTVGSYFASWVEHLAGNGWEVILAHVGGFRDRLTERLAAQVHAEVTLDGGIVDNSTKLHGVGADLLLYPEVGMDYRTLGLAALRLAPRQACAWGHPVTSGLATIDAFVSCAEMEPADAAEHYSERLILLPGLGTRYLSPDIPAAVARAELGLPPRGTLYLVPQSLFKVHPDNDQVFVDIVRADRTAVLVFFAGVEPGALRAFRARLEQALRDAGVDPARQMTVLPMRSRTDYLRINLACDVMLDSLHWSGGNTSLDALHARLPVVTSPGRFMRGRQSQAMLRRLDCADLVAASSHELAQLAVALANDPARRRDYAARIDANLTRLTQAPEPLQQLDASLRRLITDS